MSLYHLLFVISGDDQKKADEIIKKHQPDVKETISPHKKDKKMKHEDKLETSYTRLRNEIAHKREGCSPEKTRNEIDSYVNKFQNIVKQAVLEKI
jgi:hypothetical protein